MMTLEEMWESLKQDPEIKATMEEVEKSYKLFKENVKLKMQLVEKVEFGKFKSAEELLKAYQNLEREFTKSRQKLAVKEKEIEESDDEWREICDGKLETINRLIEEKHELQQSQNQTAIAELEKVKQEFNGAFSISVQQEMFNKYIDQQIKSLKGEK